MNAGAVRRAGQLAWAFIVILALAVVAGYVFQKLTLLVVPLILALFPATLLVPVVRMLEKWRLPRTIAALITLVGSLHLFWLLAWVSVTLVIADLPDLVESAGEGVATVEGLVQRAFPEFQIPGLDGVPDLLRDRLYQGADEDGNGGGGWPQAS